MCGEQGPLHNGTLGVHRVNTTLHLTYGHCKVCLILCKVDEMWQMTENGRLWSEGEIGTLLGAWSEKMIQTQLLHEYHLWWGIVLEIEEQMWKMGHDHCKSSVKMPNIHSKSGTKMWWASKGWAGLVWVKLKPKQSTMPFSTCGLQWSTINFTHMHFPTRMWSGFNPYKFSPLYREDSFGGGSG